jgi:hypothetical protein
MWRCRRASVGFSAITFLILAVKRSHDDFEMHRIPCCRLMLANCCALGSGCAPESGAPIAWDGLGSAPTDDTQPARPKKHARVKREIIVGPLDVAATAPNNKVQLKDQWEQQQAADQDEEAKLKRKLMICCTCLAPESPRDDAAGSVSR